MALNSNPMARLLPYAAAAMIGFGIEASISPIAYAADAKGPQNHQQIAQAGTQAQPIDILLDALAKAYPGVGAQMQREIITAPKENYLFLRALCDPEATRTFIEAAKTNSDVGTGFRHLLKPVCDAHYQKALEAEEYAQPYSAPKPAPSAQKMPIPLDPSTKIQPNAAQPQTPPSEKPRERYTLQQIPGPSRKPNPTSPPRATPQTSYSTQTTQPTIDSPVQQVNNPEAAQDLQTRLERENEENLRKQSVDTKAIESPSPSSPWDDVWSPTKMFGFGR